MGRGLSRLFLGFDEAAKIQVMHDTAWADGLRGIAAVFVVTSHLVLCYARGLIPPCCAEDSDQPSLFQLPILRLVGAGSSWVAVFFVLLGFVNSLKPIKTAREGLADTAASKLAAASFGRVLRLVLPASCVTVLSWFLCQLGLYTIAAQSDAYWLYENTPQRDSTATAAVGNLFGAIIDTWRLFKDNKYDQPQWAMLYLLQGSVMLSAALLITVNMAPLWRTVCLVVFSYWSLDWTSNHHDPWVGTAVFTGAILAEFSLSSIPSRLAPYSPLISIPLGLLSLVFMSYPTMQPERVWWSASLLFFQENHFPGLTVGVLERAYQTIGALLMTFCIIISPHLRLALSRKPLLWLGKISFAIYLLHGTVLRTVFAWVMFLGSPMQEYTTTDPLTQELTLYWRYPIPRPSRCTLATIVAGAVILGASDYWNLRWEPRLAKATAWIENLVGFKESTANDLLWSKESQPLFSLSEDTARLA